MNQPYGKNEPKGPTLTLAQLFGIGPEPKHNCDECKDGVRGKAGVPCPKCGKRPIPFFTTEEI